MKKFGSSDTPEEIPFQVGKSKEIFRAIGTPPGGLFLDLAKVSQAETNVEKVQVVSEFFDNVLTEDSLEKWNARFQSGAKKHVIGLEEALEVFEWLVEKYAGDDLPTEGA